MRVALIGFAGLALAFGACSKFRRVESKSAVQEAIEAHLRRRAGLMLANMTTEVEDATFKGDTAEALVKYRSKDSPDLAVSVRYTLRRVKDHWEVESSSPAGGPGANPHGVTNPHPSADGQPGNAAPPPQSSH